MKLTKCATCKRPIYLLRRGCCRPCYDKYVVMVRRGVTSWESLLQEGKITPALTGLDRPWARSNRSIVNGRY